MITLAGIQRAFASREARISPGRRRAAVAVMLNDASSSGVEMLFIERAYRLFDPWSGHIAFPGGRVAASDVDVRAAAERETREEVGLDLAGAELVGRLDDLQAGIPLIAQFVLSAFVYWIGVRHPLNWNHEVRTAMWVPVSTLLNRENHVGYRWGPVRFPGVCVDDAGRHVVWGLTYRLLDSFFTVVGTPLVG